MSQKLFPCLCRGFKNSSCTWPGCENMKSETSKHEEEFILKSNNPEVIKQIKDFDSTLKTIKF